MQALCRDIVVVAGDYSYFFVCGNNCLGHADVIPCIIGLTFHRSLTVIHCTMYHVPSWRGNFQI